MSTRTTQVQIEVPFVGTKVRATQVQIEVPFVGTRVRATQVLVEVVFLPLVNPAHTQIVWVGI